MIAFPRNMATPLLPSSSTDALAQGRSPYDDVVRGEGEEDPRAPPQEYDEKGRPTNAETKKINRDIVRSHNEVMLVIGVAEPENGVTEQQALARGALHMYEEQTGRKLFFIGRAFELTGFWGINGMRQRILVRWRVRECAGGSG